MFSIRSIIIVLIAMKNSAKPTKPKSTHPNNNNNTNKLLDVYIRNNQKQALLIHTTPSNHLQQISRVINTRFRVPPEHQILFHNGLPINLDEQNPQITLQNKSIIHLVDRRNIHSEIIINIRRLNLPNPQQYRIPSSQIIEDFIVRNIRNQQPQKLFFVYTGRQLNRSRTFAQEYVENNSELFCLHEERDEVKGQRREYYQKRMQEEQAAKKQQHVASRQIKTQQEIDQGLENYLPKQEQEKREELKSESRSEQISKDQLKPNFKKKNTTKQINLASNEPNSAINPYNQEETLSIIAETNFQQNRSAIANSGFFNEGSSISEIVAQDSHNPQSCKKIEQGSLFQSAFIGLSNQASFVNQNPISRQISASIQPQAPDTSQNDQRQSFSFDARAPQLIPSQPIDRHLTVFQRQILQVTQSEQLSRQVQLQNQKQKNQQKIQHIIREQQAEIQNSQFEFGQIQNHQLSASTEMGVLFQQKDSPLKQPTTQNQILIEDQEQNEKIKSALNTIQEQPLTQQDLYEPDIYPPNQNNSQHPSLQSQPQTSQKNPTLINEQKQQQSNPNSDITSPQEIDIFVIQNEINQPITNHGSQIIQQKQQVQTNGPSGSSNFGSKNSSRVKPPIQNNQYQFGKYEKHTNPAMKIYQHHESSNLQSEQQLLDTPKQSRNTQNEAIQLKKQQPNNNPMQQDHSLQIIDFPIDIKNKQNSSSLLLDFDSQLSSKQKSQTQPNNNQHNHIFAKQQSKIDQLNNLISSLSSKNSQLNKQNINNKDTTNMIISDQDLYQISNQVTKDKNYNQPNPKHQNHSSSELKQITVNQKAPSSPTKSQTYSHITRQQLAKTLEHYTSNQQPTQQPVIFQFSPNQYVFPLDPNQFNPFQYFLSSLQKQPQIESHHV